MPVQVITTNPNVRQNMGKAAIMRGPLVYCLEEADNGTGLHKLRLPVSFDGQTKGGAEFTIGHNFDLDKSVTTISCQGYKVTDWTGDNLYKPYSTPQYEQCILKFIPYYAWANHSHGEMLVWVCLKA